MGLRIYQLVKMQFTINTTLLYFGVHLVALGFFPQDGMPARKTWSYVHCVRIGEGLVKYGNDTHAHGKSIATHNPSKHMETSKTNKSMLITPMPSPNSDTDFSFRITWFKVVFSHRKPAKLPTWPVFEGNSETNLAQHFQFRSLNILMMNMVHAPELRFPTWATQKKKTVPLYWFFMVFNRSPYNGLLYSPHLTSFNCAVTV